MIPKKIIILKESGAPVMKLIEIKYCTQAVAPLVVGWLHRTEEFPSDAQINADWMKIDLSPFPVNLITNPHWLLNKIHVEYYCIIYIIYAKHGREFLCSF